MYVKDVNVLNKLIAFILTIMMATAVVPAAAQPDDVSASSSTPSADATAEASPMASPVAGAIEEGSWELTDGGTNYLQLELTAIEDPEVDGVQVVEDFDPEEGSESEGITFVEEFDAPEGCRVLQYEASDMDVFVAICSNDEFGMFVIGTEEEAVTDVAQKFVDGEENIVPEGYTEDESGS